MATETLPPGVRGGAPAHRRPRDATTAEPLCDAPRSSAWADPGPDPSPSPSPSPSRCARLRRSNPNPTSNPDPDPDPNPNPNPNPMRHAAR
eukprot:scaffold74862_cov31-Phaeocystis_antarctica.AAC.1